MKIEESQRHTQFLLHVQDLQDIHTREIVPIYKICKKEARYKELLYLVKESEAYTEDRSIVLKTVVQY